MRLLKLLLLVMFVCAAGPAVAGPFGDALAAYEKGDYVTAVRLVRPLADQGDAFAQILLGGMYSEGKGVSQDFVQAVSWYRKAAERGFGDARMLLGQSYASGKGVPQSYAMAELWYRQAAEQGNVAAQYNLGLMYERGQGVPQDYVQAHMWINLAASGFPGSAKERDEEIANVRDLLAAKMTPAQIAEAQKRAREWKPKQ